MLIMYIASPDDNGTANVLSCSIANLQIHAGVLKKKTSRLFNGRMGLAIKRRSLPAQRRGGFQHSNNNRDHGYRKRNQIPINRTAIGPLRLGYCETAAAGQRESDQTNTV